MDDYSEISDTQLELKVIDIFRRNKSSFTMGVIPFVSSGFQLGKASPIEVMLAERKAKYLRDAASDGTIEIALHGYNHRSNYESDKAEFIGIDYEEQLRRITVGKRHLEQATGLPVTLFIPPWNAYNQATIQALKSQNISAMSADMKYHHEDFGLIKLIPFTCEINDLERAVNQARESEESKPLIVVMMHEYDFLDNNTNIGVISLESFESLITRLASQSNVTIESLATSLTSSQQLTTDRFLLNHHIRKAEKYLPSRINSHKELVYRSKPNGVWRQVSMFYCGVLCLAILLTSFACKLVALQSGSLQLAICLVLILGCAGASYRMFSKNEYPPRILTTVVWGLGTVLGVLVHSIHKSKGSRSNTKLSSTTSLETIY